MLIMMTLLRLGFSDVGDLMKLNCDDDDGMVTLWMNIGLDSLGWRWYCDYVVMTLCEDGHCECVGMKWWSCECRLESWW